MTINFGGYVMSTATLDEILEKVEEKAQNYWDVETVFEGIEIDNETGKLNANDDFDVRSLTLGRHATEDVLSRFSLPKNFTTRLTPDLYAPVVNHLMDQQATNKILVRGDGDMVRAILGPRYKTIDNLTLVRILHELFAKNPDVRVKGWSLKEGNFSLRLVDETKSLNEVGDLRGGIHIANSEIGSWDTMVDPFIERLACSNGMVVYMKPGENAHDHVDYGCNTCGKGYHRTRQAIRIDRTVQDPEEFKQAIIGYATTALDLSKDGLKEFAATQDINVNYPVALIEHLSKQEGFDKDVIDRVADAWYQEQAMNKFAVINAFTATAKEMDGEEKYAMEQFAGDLVFSCLPEESKYLSN